ncbi:hypothetical protein TWF730_011273 [Orbilia blumenaviensis]|uniref:Peptidase C14 caspase domain-containing protein n=1 Tax=Orbilia blumenaviensis TaxID=1796055 RepID=A0AAV9UKN0_9PEZI
MASKPETWALLLGVNHYIPGDRRGVKYSDLSGCVKDVEALKCYLQKRNVQQITTLTSTKNKSGEGTEEDEALLPKRPNVIRELERIIDESSPGDLVYIHYSGHGIRREDAPIEDDGDHIAGTALALADVMAGGAYLTGYQLGVYIKNMVLKKKLRVTVVLDSCFSGRGLREAESEEYTLRSGDDEFDTDFLASDIEADRIAELMDFDYDNGGDCDASGTRNATKIRSWLTDPTGCTVLTACDIDETAGEFTFQGEKHGILTYWMLQYLLESPENRRPTYSKIREYVAHNIERAKPTKKQSPVLLGDADHIFLGQEQVVEKLVGHIIAQNTNTNVVELDIGWAHGVAKGAVYDVFPEKENVRTDSIPMATAHITEVPDNNPFRSRATLHYSSDGVDAVQVKLGCIVLLQTWSLRLDTYVDISSFRSDQRLSEEQIQTLESNIKQTPGLLLDSDVDESDEIRCDFKVTLSEENLFKIYRWENGEETLVPRVTAVSIDKEDWSIKLASLLSHIARFHDIKSIDNGKIDNPLKPEWFSFDARLDNYNDGEEDIDDDDSRDYFTQISEDPSFFKASEGANILVSFAANEACEYDSVYVSFYAFDASWGISKLHPGTGQASFKVKKDTSQEFGLYMAIPPKNNPEDPDEIIDTVRVYISTTRINWDDITLPELSGDDSADSPKIITVPNGDGEAEQDSDAEDTEVTDRGISPHATTSDANDTDSEDVTSRNPKRRPAKARSSTKKEPLKGRWAIMDLKIVTSPTN